MGWQGEEAAMHVIGVDVSKAKLDCAVIVQVEPMKRRQKVVSNDPQGWAKLLEWACQNAGCEAGELKLVLEPTSSYHEGVAHYAHDRGARVWIINPKQMRDFAKGLGVRSKTDALDCSVLAQFGLKAQAMDWMPAPCRCASCNRCCGAWRTCSRRCRRSSIGWRRHRRAKHRRW